MSRTKLPKGPLNRTRPDDSHTTRNSWIWIVIIVVVIIGLLFWPGSKSSGDKPNSGVTKTHSASQNPCTVPLKDQTCDQPVVPSDLNPSIFARIFLTG